MKYFISMLMLIFITCASASYYQWGVIGSRDRVVVKKILKHKGTSGEVEKITFTVKTRYVPITAVRVIDRKNYHSFVSMVAGGIGAKNFTIEIESQRGKYIDALVQAWGR